MSGLSRCCTLLVRLATVGVLISLLLSPTASAQGFQRVLMSAGSFKVSPARATWRPGICLNEGRSVAPSGASLGNLLRGAGSATVKRANGTTIPLNEAIEKGIVKVEGGTDIGGHFFSTEDVDINLGEPTIWSANREPIDDLDGVDLTVTQGQIWRALREQDTRRLIAGKQSLDDFKTAHPESEFLAITHNGDETHVLTRAEIDFDKEDFDSPGWNPEDRGFDVITYSKKDGTSKRRPIKFEAKDTLWNDPLAGRLSRALDAEESKRVKAASTPRTHFISCEQIASGDNAKVSVQIGQRRVELPSSELVAFLGGGEAPPLLRDALQSLPDGSRLIIRRNELVRGASDLAGSAGTSGVYASPTRLVQRLQSVQGNRLDVFLDDEWQVARLNVDVLPRVVGPESIEIFDDAQSLPEKDRRIILEIEDTLKAAGIRVVRADADMHAPNILVITGRKRVEFTELLETLHMEGALDRRLVALFSCGEGGEEALNSRLIGGGGFFSSRGPSGVLFYPERIHPQAVQEVLKAMVPELSQPTSGMTFKQVLDRAVRRATEVPELAPIRSQIEKLKDAVLQISQAVRTNPETNERLGAREVA